MSRSLPKRLEEELEELRKSSPLYKPETQSIDQLLNESKEKFLYDSVLGTSPSSGAHNNNSISEKFDMVLTSRLVAVEQENGRLRQSVSKLTSDVSRLEQENSELKSLLGYKDDKMKGLIEVRADNSRLQLQVMQMEQFLAEYNLAWVGYDHVDTWDINGKNDLNSRSQLEAHDNNKQELDQKKGEEMEVETTPTINVYDADLLLSKLLELNEKLSPNSFSVVRNDFQGRRSSRRNIKEGDIQSSVRNLCARLVQAEEQLSNINLAVYQDGILINRGPFRYHDSASCLSFVKDVTDGFFPSELRDLYPEGTVFKIADKRGQVYEDSIDKNNSSWERARESNSRNGHSGKSKDSIKWHTKGSNKNNRGTTDMSSPMQLQQLSHRLPPSVITVGGDIIQVRKDITSRLDGTSGTTTSGTPTSREVYPGTVSATGRVGGADCNKVVRHIPTPAALACMWDIGMKRQKSSTVVAGEGDLSPQKNLDKSLSVSMVSEGLSSTVDPCFEARGDGDDMTCESGLQALGDNDDLASVQIKWYNDTDVYIVKMYGSDVIGDLVATVARHVHVPQTQSQVQQSPSGGGSGSSKRSRGTPGRQRGASSLMSPTKSSRGSRAAATTASSTLISSSFSLHSVFPPRKLDNAMTLREAGLVPNGTVYARKVTL